MKQNTGLTWRAVLIAFALTLVISFWVEYNSLTYNGPDLVDHVPPAAPVIMLAILVMARKLPGKLGLGRAEIVVIYSMVVVSTSLTSIGLVHRFLPGLTTPFYLYSASTDRFAALLKYIPRWLVPGDENSQAVAGFFEGSKSGIPWAAWMIPLLMWSLLLFVVFFMMLCIVSCLHRQWLDKENLSLPLIELPMEIIGKEGESPGGASIFRDRMMWVGFAIPVIIFGINGIHHYVLGFPSISLSLNFQDFLLEKPLSAMAPRSWSFVFSFSPLMIGIAYILSSEVSFSIWFFFLLSRVQYLIAEIFGLSNVTGVTPGIGFETGGEYFADVRFPFLYEQSRGALIAIVVFITWTARSHIRDVLRKAFRGAPDVDDSGEPLSYRMSILGLIGGMALCCLWVYMAGLPLIYALIFFSLFFIFTLAFVRMRVDAGIPYYTRILFPSITMYIVFGTGVSFFSHSDFIILTYLQILPYSCLFALMAVQFESFRMSRLVGVSPKRMALALILAFVLGLGVSYLSSLSVLYKYGLAAVSGGIGESGADAALFAGRTFHHFPYYMSSKDVPTDWLRIAFGVAGFAFTSFLMVMRRLYLHWPFHPLGYAFGTAFGDPIWSAMLIGWVVKTVVLKYGGVQLYRRARPVFLGMMFGHLFMKFFWAVVALIDGEMSGGFTMPL